ncbi:FAD-dependent monooxygenase [Amycolatopsis silviterrae]|uniref:FAD-dependent monooxygenase n=1 Tax=Amycolatopsis silviterrae TaxID=1656914 RepID=A0ABW5HD50_9PSEU
MREIEADVCVSGGGPAGLVLALLLARSGVDVVVAERSASLDREYRGEIIQPGALRALDQLGVLDGIGGYPMRHFQLVQGERTLLDIDYETLPAPYDHLLSLPQRLLLERLLDECKATPGFRLLSGCSTRALLTENGAVTGIRCGSGDGETEVHARWVVAADGRYSKTRSLAGIGYDKFEKFEHDVVWFKLVAPDRRTGAVRIHRTAADPVLVHDSYPDRVQIGWTLAKGSYKTVAAKGIEYVREQLAAAVPQHADLIRDQVTALSELSPLDVFSGRAQEWVRPGLVLIGDASHTHSPIGAQGINLAIADAVALHPELVAAVTAGDNRTAALAGFEAERRAAVDTVFTLQSRQNKGMLSSGRIVDAVRPVVAKLLPHTPIFRKILNLVAFGARPRDVRVDLFRAPSNPGGTR